MSTTERRVCVCSGTAPAPPQEALPVDLLLEIVAFADVATVVRCAATGRILRRAILDPAFRRRPALAHLLAVSFYREEAYCSNVTTHTHRLLVHTPDPTKLRLCSRRESFKPVASRDGLLVLRRHGDVERRPANKVELWARHIFTGHVTSLPPTPLPYADLHVVLSVGDARRSFELLVAHMNERFYQTFSSKDSQWSAIRQVFVPHTGRPCWDSDCSAVIGRTVYFPRHVNACHWDHTLALDVDSGQATMMELPAACFSRMMTSKRDQHLLLAPVRGRLCVFVAESGGLAMWTLTSSLPASWIRQVVISSLEIARQAALPVSFTLKPLNLVGFGEGTRGVILYWQTMDDMQFLRLDLGTKEEAAPVVVFKLGSPENGGPLTRYFLHEVDLVSLLQPMKSF